MNDGKILCAIVTLPNSIAKKWGYKTLATRADTLAQIIEEEFLYDIIKVLSVKVKFVMRTQKWLDKLPEMD